MLIAYFDEVKHQKDRPFYWLGALIADADLIRKLEEQCNDLAGSVFGSRQLTKGTEFHAADIMNGHEHFKGWEWERRIDVLKRLTTILGSAEGLAKVYVKINVELIVHDIDIEAEAFMHLVERVDSYMFGQKLPGMLIGDRENEVVSGKFAESLSQYRTVGTARAFGKEVRRLLDTVHFTHSHHSRMLQLADLYVWLRQLRAAGDHGKWHRKEIIDHIASIDNCLSPVKYKEWPTEDSWTKRAAKPVAGA